MFVAPVARADGEAVTPRDLEAAFAQMDALGRFFGAFAARDTNGFARERWHRLSLGYPGTAKILRGLLVRNLLLIDDLPPGRVSGLLDRGEIVVDRDLDGRWLTTPLQRGRAGEAERRLDLLIPALFQALARRQPPQDWPWLADHLRAVGGLGRLAQDPVARPLLARFFQAKDAYLWLSMQRVGEGDPSARKVLARRQMETFRAIRNLSTDMAATFGAAPAARLQRDWADYVALVDGFAVTRGWVLLDPSLRQTQLGAAARREADAIDLAAAEVMASSPRSALAAARAEVPRAAAARRAQAQAEPSGVTLDTVLAQTTAADLQALAATLPMQSLALRPEASVQAMSPAAYRAFAESLRKAAAQPDPGKRVAEAERQLGAARQEVATLKSRVGELSGALEAGAAEKARLESALAAERTRAANAEQHAADLAETSEQQLAAAEAKLAAQRADTARQAAAQEAERQATEQRAAEEAAEAHRRLAEAEARLAEQQSAIAAARAAADRAVAEKAAAERAAKASQIAVVPPPAAAEDSEPYVNRAAKRQFYIMAIIAVMLILGLLLWLRGRRRAVAVERAPLLLTAPAPAAAAGPPLGPIIGVPEGVSEQAAEVRSQSRPARPPAGAAPPRQPIHINGVKPPTAAAKAAMKAGNVRRQAARASAEVADDADDAAAGNEADAAANPIVRALRQGNLPLFEMLFSELTDLRSPQLQRIVYGGRGEDLAIVCRAVGVDKLLFGSIFMLTDHLRGGDADEEPERAAEILRMYDRMPPATARKVLAKWQRNWSGARRAEPPSDG